MEFMHFHGFICISKDFIRFHEISWISGVGGFAASANVCHRDDASKETFTRFQLAAFSSIFMDFRGFHEILSISCIHMDFDVFLKIWLAGLAGWLLAAG